MILPVYWDLAAILIAKEMDSFEPAFVMMNGVAGQRQPIWIELGATNEGVPDAITARFLECANYSGLAEFRCVRDPQRATVFDARGQFLLEASRSGDVVHLEVTPNDLAHVQVEFSVPPPPVSES